MISKYKAAVATLSVLVAVGVAAWIFQLANGLGVTGMNNGTSWGIYITNFMFFVGLSAGGLIVASSASVFGIKKFKKIALPAVILSTVSIVVAGMFILVDLGGIQRVWKMLVSPNVTSPLVWDCLVISIYLVINIVYLRFMTKKDADKSKLMIVSCIALPVAILVHSVTAWIFGLQLSREGWYSAIMAPLFVVSAMDSGLALLILALLGLEKVNVFKTEKTLIASLAGLLATCVALDFYFIGSEILTMAYPGAGGAETLAIMTTGATAPFFWFEIVAGLLIPFALLIPKKNRSNAKVLTLASVLIVAGVFFKRVWLLLTSFVHFNVTGYPGVTIGNANQIDAAKTGIWTLFGNYAPTPVELLVVVGVISFGALLFVILCKRFLAGKTASQETSEAVGTDMAAANLA